MGRYLLWPSYQSSYQMSKGLKACRGIHLALHSQPFILYHQPRLLRCYYLIYTFNKSRSTTSSIWPRDNKLAIINDNESMIHSSLDAIYVWIILFASLVNNNHCNYGKVEYIYWKCFILLRWGYSSINYHVHIHCLPHLFNVTLNQLHFLASTYQFILRKFPRTSAGDNFFSFERKHYLCIIFYIWWFTKNILNHK